VRPYLKKKKKKKKKNTTKKGAGGVDQGEGPEFKPKYWGKKKKKKDLEERDICSICTC
jgi:hypothetical protein